MDFDNNKSNGLDNLGNTCFFNSILQLLYQCTILNKLLLINDFDSSLIKIYKDFLLSYSNNSNPSNIVRYISNILGRTSNSQEDAEQYLNYIIDTIIDELNIYIKNNSLEYLKITDKDITLSSLVENFFTLQIKKNIICPKCNHISNTNDNINKLYLSINSDKLNDMIINYLNETLDDNNKYKCDSCNNYVNARIEREIIKFPKYLIITLKRYSNQNSKINKEIEMYKEFTMDKKYELRGIVYHSGSTNGGHYVYYGKKNNIWYLYNDSSVSRINDEKLNNIIKYGYIYLYVSK